MKKLAVMVALLVGFGLSIETVDAAEYNRFKVKRIISKSKCFKCHAITREKVGPAYISVSQRFGNDPDGRQKIYTHLTTSPEVEVEGKMENHVNLKAGGDEDIEEVITWLLSLREVPKYKKYLAKTEPAVESTPATSSAPSSAPARASTPPSAPARASTPPSAPARASTPPSAPARESTPPSAPARASTPSSAPASASAPPSAPASASPPPSAPAEASASESAPARASTPSSAPARASTPPSAPARASTPPSAPSRASASDNEDAPPDTSDDDDGTSWFEELFEGR